MAIRKFIYWESHSDKRNGEGFANVHIISECQDRLFDFQGLARILRRIFPQATKNQIHCGRVYSSPFYRGHAIITWCGKVPKGKYTNWHQGVGEAWSYRW